MILVKDFWKWTIGPSNKEIFAKDFIIFHLIKTYMTIKDFWSLELINHIKYIYLKSLKHVLYFNIFNHILNFKKKIQNMFKNVRITRIFYHM